MIRYEKQEPAPDKSPWYSCWDGPRMIGNVFLIYEAEPPYWAFYPSNWMSLHYFTDSLLLDLGHKLQALNTNAHA